MWGAVGQGWGGVRRSDNAIDLGMPGMSDAASEFAALLIAARRDPAARVKALPAGLVPADRAAAYAVQHKVAASFAGIGGWKVGAPGGGEPICGALPASGVQASPSVLSAATHPYRGIEAEVAFRMGADLPPRAAPYSRAEVVAAIAGMYPVIEELESRFAEPDTYDLMTNLADTQSHGGLIYGPELRTWQGVDLAKEHCQQFVDGKLHTERTGYPFGDILKMVEWVANTGAVWAGGLKAGQFVTCGSWTGKACVAANAEVRVVFPSLGEVHLRYAA
jgi:2-keto-4-pentenoate hydratase